MIGGSPHPESRAVLKPNDHRRKSSANNSNTPLARTSISKNNSIRKSAYIDNYNFASKAAKINQIEDKINMQIPKSIKKSSPNNGAHYE